MGSSPRFPMYESDFGWRKPFAVRNGRANKFDGKISAILGHNGGGSIDLEVVLAPETHDSNIKSVNGVKMKRIDINCKVAGAAQDTKEKALQIVESGHETAKTRKEKIGGLLQKTGEQIKGLAQRTADAMKHTFAIADTDEDDPNVTD
ncbi:Uncharacterized protein Fot_35866 [Forsythia ovata]|uniref:Uncharacterized protein n=1 Tax=Forsythia ovata TaxID=205694 RepID=A0ABD1SNW1_9LAMI